MTKRDDMRASILTARECNEPGVVNINVAAFLSLRPRLTFEEIGVLGEMMAALAERRPGALVGAARLNRMADQIIAARSP